MTKREFKLEIIDTMQYIDPAMKHAQLKKILEIFSRLNIQNGPLNEGRGGEIRKRKEKNRIE